ncbi:hypothetical protein J0A65_02480 [Bowmanella sp. Y57]|uniref:Very short patch repair endonuclease n=1 Tax=Bowmanella yangjiangensis TaxID=2811230 RepID=A0ABS3CQG6_9ALTE|nr:hypothetical protein [Bowmanella yangjiangensis]
MLHGLGFRFRNHRKELPGTPAIVLPNYKTCIFVHGYFWHHHKDCKKASLPKTNTSFWECETKFPESLQSKILRVIKA